MAKGKGNPMDVDIVDQGYGITWDSWGPNDWGYEEHGYAQGDIDALSKGKAFGKGGKSEGKGKGYGIFNGNC